VSRKTIYGESYTTESVDKSELLEAFKVRKEIIERAKRAGVLLKEEQTRSQTLQSRINRLEEENRRLKESLAKRSR
jgi:cell shape-determining protein MreC